MKIGLVVTSIATVFLSACAVTGAGSKDANLLDSFASDWPSSYRVNLLSKLPYMNRGNPGWMAGGYSNKKDAPSQYVISYEGNVYTSRPIIEKYINRRAEELCGINNYVQLEKESGSNSMTIMTGNAFIGVNNPTNTVRVQCNTSRAEYYESVLDGSRERCDIPVNNYFKALFIGVKTF
ncbi:MAG: hypothetical protein JKY67_08700 [Pseudomonadales bacterium]|nr:hypothetical protein [Pseudomonadales bacterium]